MPDRPSLFPRWATNPPPGDHVTEPTEPEKDAGWSPATAQVDRISITGVADAALYSFAVAWPGQAAIDVDYTSGVGATAEDIRDGLIAAAAAAVGTRVTAAADGAAALQLTAVTGGDPFTATATTGNLSRAPLTANVAGRPRRQYMNWLQSLVYRWVLWLDSAIFRWSDIGNEWFVPGVGAAPAAGAGLLGTSGAAAAYIQGHRVEASSEPHEYPASADTYVDLHRDGVWIYTSLPNASPTPAVPAGAVRTFVVVTNATDRATVQDFRGTHVPVSQPLDLHRTVRFGHGRRGSLVERAEARRQTYYAGGGGNGYTLLEEWLPDSGISAATRLYLRHSDGAPVVVRGARWNGADWSVDLGAGVCVMRSWPATSADGRPTETIRLQPPPSNPFADAVWYAAMTDGGGVAREEIRHGTVDVALTGNDYERARVPNHRNRIDGAVRNLIADDGTSHAYAVPPGGGGTAGATRGRERAINATYNEATGLWSRTAAGDAYKLELSSIGLRLLRHPAAGAATWADTVSPSTWQALLLVDGGLRSFRKSIIGGAARFNVSNYLSVDQADHTTDIAAYRLEKAAGGSVSAIYPLALPDGATITSVTVNGNVTSGLMRASVLRKGNTGPGTAVAERLHADVVPLVASGDTTIVVTTDNIVNNADYSYLVWVGMDGASQGNIVRLGVEYSIVSLLP